MSAYTRMSMEVIVTIVSKLGYFTYLGDEINLTYIGVRTSSYEVPWTSQYYRFKCSYNSFKYSERPYKWVNGCKWMNFHPTGRGPTGPRNWVDNIHSHHGAHLEGLY